MELQTILAADYANIAQGDKINVMGIFRNIYATKFPARNSSMFLVVKLGADLGEYGDERAITIMLLDTDGNQIMKFEQNITVPQPHDGQRPEINFLLQLNDLVFPTPGRYQFLIKVDKDLKGELPLDVVLIEQPKKLEEKEK